MLSEVRRVPLDVPCAHDTATTGHCPHVLALHRLRTRVVHRAAGGWNFCV